MAQEEPPSSILAEHRRDHEDILNMRSREVVYPGKPKVKIGVSQLRGEGIRRVIIISFPSGSTHIAK
jgi:hypothetical protein